MVVDGDRTLVRFRLSARIVWSPGEAGFVGPFAIDDRMPGTVEDEFRASRACVAELTGKRSRTLAPSDATIGIRLSGKSDGSAGCRDVSASRVVRLRLSP